MDRLSLTESLFPQFSVDEIMVLERIYQDMGEKSLDRNICQEIAISLSSSSNRASKTSFTSEQVQHWFQNKRKESPETPKLVVDLSDAPILRNGHKSSSSPKGTKVADITELAFEARSSKDFAWHDVASFLNFRNLSTGELEVRVRYAGFSKEQDEWINVKEGVRERSIPLEPSECHKVKVGDLVLCFLEREDYALYCDARVVEIQRKIHDPTECRCIFIVRFVHDKTEEGVSLERICCRPTQEESVVSLNPIESLWG